MKKFIASAAAALLIAGGVVTVTALPAAAHTGDLNVSYVCDTSTGEYVGTATLDISQTNLSGATMWKNGTSNFEGTPNNADGLNRGPVNSTGAGTITLGQFRIPGDTTTKGPWVYAFTRWSDSYGKGSDGQSYDRLAGDCRVPVVVPEKPAPEVVVTPVDTLDCNTRVVTTVTTTTTTDWTLVNNVWVKAAPTSTTANTTREATAQECPIIPPPPTLQACTALGNGGTSTNLAPNGWTFTETRSTGHNDYVDGGLHVWTEGTTSTDKAAGYKAASFDLKDAGSGFNISAINASGGFPGLQLMTDLDADGDYDGYLVYEPTYGANTLWLSANWGGADLTNAPTTINGGGTGKGGTANQWLEHYPNAKVGAIGYSLGSGVKGDLVITDIYVGCTRYSFDYERPVPEQPQAPEPTVVTTYGEWTGGEPTCTNPEVQQTRTVTRETTTYGFTWNSVDWVWEPNESTVTEVLPPETRTLTYDGEPCPTPEPTDTPTPTPTQTSTPTPSATSTPAAVAVDKLAVTGQSSNWAPVFWFLGLTMAIGAGFLTLSLVRQRRLAKK